MVEPIVEQAIGKLGTVREAAAHLGVSRELVYRILSGKCEPSDNILAKLGLMRVTFIRPDNNDPAEKRKSRKERAA